VEPKSDRRNRMKSRQLLFPIVEVACYRAEKIQTQDSTRFFEQ
jgi:hypothetical protein